MEPPPAPAVPDDNRRGAERHEFPHQQFVGSVVPGQPPTETKFQRVHFRDLSQTGFSYYVGNAPTETEVVAALGSGSNQLHVFSRRSFAKFNSPIPSIVRC